MIKWSRKTWIIAIGILLAVSFLMQGRLFFPHISLVATPEFELNDAIQLSFASKYWYFMKLHAFQLPFWSMEMGNGFPVLGEGQTGIGYIPNIIIYACAPNPEIGYNLSLVGITFLTSLGTCVWLSMLGVVPPIAILASITFSSGGFFLFHLQHMTLLQSFSLFPLLFVAVHNVIRQRRVRDGILLAFLFSQQIYAGFIQAVFITFLGTTLYAFFLWKKTGAKKQSAILFCASYIFGVLLAAPQLLPSIEFYQNIIGQTMTNGFSTTFSFAPRSFLSFINPFAIGNPKFATYYMNAQNNGLQFWETNGYIGIIPLIFLGLSVINRKLRTTILPWGILMVIGILLMLGKYSPCSFIFGFFPFSIFRVPARFIILVSFSLITIAALSASHLMQKKSRLLRSVIVLCWIINCSALLPYWYTYHDYQSPKTIQQPPEILTSIPKGSVIYRFDPATQHRNIFMKYGWTNPTKFAIFQNILRPNTNIFWHATTFDAYPSRILTNKSIIDGIVNSSTEMLDTHTASMHAAATNLLILTGNSTIISGDEIRIDQQFSLTKRISDGTSTVYLYQYAHPIPHAYFAADIIPVQTVHDVMTVLENPVFDPTTAALSPKAKTEQHITVSPSDTISVLTWSDQQVILTTTAKQPMTVVINMTNYPGWNATVDEEKTTLFPVNIVSTALTVPAGTHTVKLVYQPSSFIIGMIISVGAIGSIFLLVLLSKHIRFLRKLFPE